MAFAIYLYHYLDDFIIVAPSQSSQCQQDLTLLQQECSRLGVPIAAHKTEGPSTSLVFVGVEIDTAVGELRIPEDKLRRLPSLLLQ